MIFRLGRWAGCKISDKFGYEGTAHFQAGNMGAHEKMELMLRAFLGWGFFAVIASVAKQSRLLVGPKYEIASLRSQ